MTIKTKKRRHWIALAGLPDTKPEVRAAVVRNVTDAVTCIRKGHAISAAGDAGAINVWKDKSGTLRGEFMAYCVTINAAKLSSVAEAHRWLKQWWPRMQKE